MLAAELAAMTQQERRRIRQQYDPWTWAADVARIRLPKGGALDLESRPFLRDVFRDTSREIVVIKGAQLGFSTTAMVRAFWFLTTFPVTAIYTFPTGRDVTRFTQSRINPLIRGSDYLSERIADVNSVGVKQFAVVPPHVHLSKGRFGKLIIPIDTNRSTLYFSGAANEKDATTVDADLLVHDEEDISNPQIIEQFASRLDASTYRMKFRLSTPRLPGAGIDRVWKTTDQRHWLIRCPHCNADFEMAFPGGPWDYSNIEPDPTGWSEGEWDRWEREGSIARYVCHKCGHELRDADRINGRWVEFAPAPGRPHGYYVSQLAAPWITARHVLERFRDATWKSDFWNLVIGLAWEEGTTAMTREALLSRQSAEPMAVNGQGTTMGVDVGAKFDVIVGKGQRIVHMGRYDSYADLDDLMERFGVTIAVVDAAPEEHATRAWADKYNDYGTGGRGRLTPRIRVWRASYGGGGGRGPEIVWNPTTGTVAAPRTEILSKTSQELLSWRILPKFDGSPAYEAFLTHCFNSKKVAVFVKGLESDQVLDHYEWHEIGPDHLFHASVYEHMARMAPRDAVPPIRGIVSLKRPTDLTRKEPPPIPIRTTSIRPPDRSGRR